MRSHSNNWRSRNSLLAVFAGLFLSFSALTVEAAEESSAIRQEDVSAAIEKLSADPNLATSRKVRTLRWANAEEKKTRETPSWLRWIAEFFRWIASAGRVFVWGVIALLIGLFVLYLVRFAKSFDNKRSATRSAAPTHVRDLDIRPESLPEDIGAAAWALWEQGEHRGALSLMYRGLLSRLAHAHEVPIRHSSTEGDCLMLAQRHLPATQSSYVAQLIRVWQRAVYGGQDPQGAEMRVLCEQFAAAMMPDTPNQNVLT